MLDPGVWTHLFSCRLKSNLQAAIGAAANRDKFDLVAVKDQCVRLDEVRPVACPSVAWGAVL